MHLGEVRLPVWSRIVLAQLAGLSVALVIGKTASSLHHVLPIEAGVAIASLLAVTVSLLLHLPAWWLPLQALFLPGLLLTLSLEWPPSLFLVGFVVLLLTFRNTASERVPLYLSNRVTAAALAELLPQRHGLIFHDLGCGVAGLLGYLAEQRPDSHFFGVESAPLPYFIGKLRLLKRRNAHVRFGNLWLENLRNADVVYAFLSPEPMPKLWLKAQAEMRPGSMLISNSFQIPDVPPSRTVELLDARRTRLFIWEIGRG